MGSEGGNFNISISRSLENAFPTHFFTSKDILPMADKHHFSPLISWFSDKMQEIPSPKSVHKSRQQTPQSCVVCGSYLFFFFLQPDMTMSFGYAQFRLFLFMYEQTLFNYSNKQSEHQIHFLHNPFFIGPATRNVTPLLEQ